MVWLLISEVMPLTRPMIRPLPAWLASLGGALLAGLIQQTALAAEPVLTIAVAANFSEPMQKLIERYQASAQREVQMSVGATAQLAAQIRQGAPFDVLLAADAHTPQQLCAEGLADCASIQTYAIGHLVLWSHNPKLIDAKAKVLQSAFERLSLADPTLAPYGRAAVETLASLHLLEQTRARWVLGENITQAYQFVLTENAPLGFVALSQVYANGELTQGSAWLVPDELHQPIRQDLVILKNAPHAAQARAWINWLHTSAARAIIEQYGYSLDVTH